MVRIIKIKQDVKKITGGWRDMMVNCYYDILDNILEKGTLGKKLMKSQ